MPKRTIIFGNAFQYEPSTGDLSTTEEFGSILIGQLDKYLSLSPIGTQSVFGRSQRVSRGEHFSYWIKVQLNLAIAYCKTNWYTCVV